MEKEVIRRGFNQATIKDVQLVPLVEIRDAARVYLTVLWAEEDKVKGQIFNVVYKNFRVSELAFRVRKALRKAGIKAEIKADYRYKGVRSYRVSGKKLRKILEIEPVISVEESVKDMVAKIRNNAYTDFDNPKYYNIRWMKLLEEADKVIKITGSIFEAPKTTAGSD